MYFVGDHLDIQDISFSVWVLKFILKADYSYAHVATYMYADMFTIQENM